MAEKKRRSRGLHLDICGGSVVQSGRGETPNGAETDAHRRENKKGKTAMTQETIARINALGKKSRAEGLTEEEKAEQARLRREYLDAVKRSLRSQLDSITVIDADGKETKLKEKHTKRPSE